MNTVMLVWVLFVNSHGGNYVPTTEFTSAEKCKAAIVAIQEQISASNKMLDWTDGKSHIRSPLCVRIEK